jgi:hypothetical protein
VGCNHSSGTRCSAVHVTFVQAAILAAGNKRCSITGRWKAHAHWRNVAFFPSKLQIRLHTAQPPFKAGTRHTGQQHRRSTSGSVTLEASQLHNNPSVDTVTKLAALAVPTMFKLQHAKA